MRVTRSRAAIALAATLAVIGGGLGSASVAHAAVPDPVVRYTFDSAPVDGVTVPNAAGSGSSATIVGTGATFSNGALVLPGGAYGSGAASVTVPTTAIVGQQNVTISTWLKNSTGNGNYAAAYIGNTSTTGGYWLFNPSNPSGYVKSVATTATAAATSSTPWSTEVGPGRTGAPATGRTSTSDLALYTTVINGAADTISLYVNGSLVLTSSVAVDLSNYGSASSLVAFLGKSPYSDVFFKGAIDDYAVYTSALDATQIGDLYSSVVIDKAASQFGVPSAAESAFTVPLATAGATVTWSSDNAAIAINASTGAATVTRPTAADASVTLTAHIVAGSTVADRTFTVTVPRQLTELEKAQADRDAISIANAGDIRTDFSVPTAGAQGSTIAWSVTDGGTASPVIATGVTATSKTVRVARPAAGTAATHVVLTATITNGATELTKQFAVTVSPIASDGAVDEAYVWAYFTGEGAGAERVSLAASQGNDALAWNTLNDGEPLFTSTLGTQGLRDPFILKSHDGDKFFMLATDLKVAGLAGGFTTAQISGSKYIEIYESTDLVTWTAQRHVKVSTDYAGNTWAPEAYWDDELGTYVVYWASNLYTGTDASTRTAVTYNQMMYVTTDDFQTFSAPQPWINVKRGTGLGTIDATVAEQDGTYYRFYKDEATMTIREEKSTNLLATVATSLPTTTAAAGQWSLIKEKIAYGLSNGEPGGTFGSGEGPSIFPANDGDVNGYAWYLFIDQPDYHGGPNHYIGFASDDIANGDSFVSVASKLTANLPQNSDGGEPRHGTVIPVTRAQYQTVLEAYAPDIAVTSVDAIDVSTAAGTAPVLPTTATLHTKDGATSTAAVVWDAVAPSAYAVGGTSFTVTGTAQDASRAPVEAVVTVPLATFAAATPTISGVAKVGSTLTTDAGSWGAAATLAYEWLRDGAAITGATGTRYAVQPADAGTALTVRVTASATGYRSATATSNAVTVGAGDLVVGVPGVAGTAKLGAALTASPGAWGPGAVAFGYQWLRGGSGIAGATGASYTLTAADVNATISVQVTGSLAGYASATATSASTVRVAAGALTKVTPKISGTAKVGKKLTAKAGSWKPAGVSTSYRWYRNGKAIKGATKATYKLVTADKGKRITVKVTGKKAGYTTATATSKATKKVK